MAKKITIQLTQEQLEYLTMLVETRGLLVDDFNIRTKVKPGSHVERELKTIDALHSILLKATK